MNVVVPWSWMSAEIPRPEFSREGTDETHTTAELNSGWWKRGSQPSFPSTPGKGAARLAGRESRGLK